MRYVLQLTDEQYALMKRMADAKGKSIEDLFFAWTMEQEGKYCRAHPTYDETDDWFRHLGVSDEVTERIKREIRDQAERPYDADSRVSPVSHTSASR